MASSSSQSTSASGMDSLPSADTLANNPGTIEELHKRAQNVMPMFFEGAKLMMNKGLSNSFQVSHTLTMSSKMPSGYRFGATYLGQQTILGPGESYPLLLGDMDPSGNLNANIVHAFSERLRCKCIVQIQQSKWQSTQFTTDYKGDYYTTSLTLGNPDLIYGNGVAVLHHLRSITKNLAVGAELAYQSSPQLPGGHLAVLSLCSRYTTDKFSAAAMIGNAGQWHASYYQKCSPNLQIGVEMESNLKMQESSTTIGYEIDVNSANGGLLVRGSVDSNFVVKSVLEKKLLPLPFTIALCSLINHKNSQYQFGCGLIIG